MFTPYNDTCSDNKNYTVRRRRRFVDLSYLTVAQVLKINILTVEINWNPLYFSNSYCIAQEIDLEDDYVVIFDLESLKNAEITIIKQFLNEEQTQQDIYYLWDSMMEPSSRIIQAAVRDKKQ